MEIQIYIEIQQVSNSLDGTTPKFILKMMIKTFIIASSLQICPDYNSLRDHTN